MGEEPSGPAPFEPGVRRARPTDRGELVRLGEAARSHVGHHRGGDVYQEREGRPDPLRDSLDADLAAADAGSALVLVGGLGPVVVGYAVVRLDETVNGRLAVVSDLFVEPDARGVGVGRALMEAVVEWATDSGCHGVDAEVLPGDRSTKNFFEAFGLVARKITVHRSLGERSPDGSRG